MLLFSPLTQVHALIRMRMILTTYKKRRIHNERGEETLFSKENSRESQV